MDTNNFHFYDIDELEKQYYNKYGEMPLNISNWDPNNNFNDFMTQYTNISNFNEPLFKYLYTSKYDYKNRQKIIQKLLFNPSQQKEILITHSSSNTILNAVSLLKNIKIDKLYIICPSYFSLIESCKLCDIPYELIYLEREKNEYKLIFEKFDKNSAIWITNPIYCTSVYFSENTIKQLKLLIHNNIIICDESLCLHSKELSAILGKYKNFIGIYSPHKSICLNTYKFSCMIYDNCYQNIVNQWSDIISGGFGASTLLSVEHFLSDNYAILQKEFSEICLKRFKVIKTICDKYQMLYDKMAEGYFITIYIPYIQMNKDPFDFIKDLLFCTGVLFIPSIFNYFSPHGYFSFRINLTLMDKENILKTERMFNYLYHSHFPFLSER